ncbi:MAG: hypothetical protein MZV64_56415 [Ignavibacteriales bacterium]|nr:hypothetical protein [Ignavibacteriales bacterium]
MIEGEKLFGMQHKYRETVLFFPSQGQTCHAYCTFCFRWPQFVGMEDLKFASKEAELLVKYVKDHDRGYRCFIYRRRSFDNENKTS